MMGDLDLFALCIWTEARNQPYEGMVAVSRVIYNRMAQHYESDGTIPETILAYDQFSAFYFDFVDGKYARVCDTYQAAYIRAQSMLTAAQTSAQWDDCQKAVTDGAVGSTFTWGPEGQKLNVEPRALMYVNLEVSRPAWATSEAYICKIYDHSFYKA
jgi:spore germination cell wall hydrolase CwlJ-like protein